MYPKNLISSLATMACLVLAASASAQPPPPEAAPAAPQRPVFPPPKPVRITTPVPVPFMEDFESGEINTNLWDFRVEGSATIKISQEKTAHGKNALWVHYPKGASRAYAFLAAHLPDSLHDELYGRAYIRINWLPPNHSVLLLAGTPGFPVNNFLEIGESRGQFQPSFQQNGDPAIFKRGETTAREGTIPIGRWFCLEWHFTDKPDRIVEWVDGQQVVDKSFTFNNAGSELVKGFSEFDFGFRSWGQAANVNQDIDIYYDDIEISDKPIGQLTPVPEPAAAPDAAPAAPAAPAK